MSFCVCFSVCDRMEGHLCLPLVHIDGISLMLTNTIHKLNVYMETTQPDLYTNRAGAKDTESFFPLRCRHRKSSMANEGFAFHLSMFIEHLK